MILALIFIHFGRLHEGVRCQEKLHPRTCVVEPKPSFEQLTEQLHQAQAAGDPWKEGIALNNLGSYCKDQPYTTKAVENFKNALEYFTAMSVAEKQVTVLNNLGSTYV